MLYKDESRCELNFAGKAANAVFKMMYWLILLLRAMLCSAQKIKLGPGFWKTETDRTEFLRNTRWGNLGQLLISLFLNCCETHFLKMLYIKWNSELERVTSWARQSTGNSRQKWACKKGTSKQIIWVVHEKLIQQTEWRCQKDWIAPRQSISSGKTKYRLLVWYNCW